MDEPMTREFEVALTAEEWEDRSRMLGQRVDELAQAETLKKEVVKQHGDKIKKIELSVLALARAVRTHRESRPIPVTTRDDPRRFCVETIRLDTLEVVDTRPMNDEELAQAQQGTLFGHAKATADSTDEEPPPGQGPGVTEFAPLRAPDGRVPCPGPAADGDGETAKGCLGEDCPKCAGLLFVPVEAVTSANDDGEGEDESAGTEITDPASILDTDDPRTLF